MEVCHAYQCRFLAALDRGAAPASLGKFAAKRRGAPHARPRSRRKTQATGFVRYASQSCLTAHQYSGGEEILILGRLFPKTATTTRPAGTCAIRPAPATSSDQGAKLRRSLSNCNRWQAAKRNMRFDTHDPDNWRQEQWHAVCPLFSSAAKQLRLARLASHQAMLTDAGAGLELLVQEGDLTAKGSAMRNAAGRACTPGQCRQSSRTQTAPPVSLKAGHLAPIKG